MATLDDMVFTGNAGNLDVIKSLIIIMSKWYYKDHYIDCVSTNFTYNNVKLVFDEDTTITREKCALTDSMFNAAIYRYGNNQNHQSQLYNITLTVRRDHYLNKLVNFKHFYNPFINEQSSVFDFQLINKKENKKTNINPLIYGLQNIDFIVNNIIPLLTLVGQADRSPIPLTTLSAMAKRNDSGFQYDLKRPTNEERSQLIDEIKNLERYEIKQTIRAANFSISLLNTGEYYIKFMNHILCNDIYIERYKYVPHTGLDFMYSFLKATNLFDDFKYGIQKQIFKTI